MMKIQERICDLHGRRLSLRCAEEADAAVLASYLKTVSGESDFLRCYPDEIHYTEEQEEAFIRSYNEAPDKLLLLAFLDGVYAGNASFAVPGPSRRNAHRADLGIALYRQFNGLGIGSRLMEAMIEEAGKAGFRQLELTVVSRNERAYHWYYKLGFRECGRIPRANRYDDGSFSDDIFMVMEL